MDAFEVFDQNLERLELLAGKVRLHNCARTSADLIRYSPMVNYQDGLLIGGVLGGVFGQVDSALGSREVPDDEKLRVAREPKSGIGEIRATYKRDKNSIYDALKKPAALPNFSPSAQVHSQLGAECIDTRLRSEGNE